MKISPFSPHLHCIFCEDVRIEKGDTSTIVGLFKPLLEVKAFPIILPKLAVMLSVQVETKDIPDRVNFILETSWEESPLIEYEVDKEIFSDDPNGPVDPDKEGRFFNVRSTFFQFLIPEKGRITAWVDMDDIRYRAGSLRFRQFPDNEDIEE